MVILMPLPPHHLLLVKIQYSLTFLMLAELGCPAKDIKRVSVTITTTQQDIALLWCPLCQMSVASHYMF